jgi:anaerobic selenocysteine-containing dehydrogenase
VPVTKLYDQGATVVPAELLAERIGEAFVTLNPATAKELGAEAGELVKLSWNGTQFEVRVRTDESIATGVALVPRSFGLAVREPVAVSVKSAKKVKSL